jgi:hypothetical protein
MELFYDVVDSEAGREIAEDAAWLQDAEDLAVKLFNHLGTIRYLWNGTNLPIINGRPRQYVDHSSITVLLRAAFETYLCYYYIYGDLGCSAETRKLRHDIWSLGGLLDREDATSIADCGIPVLERDKQVIARLLSDIEDNPAFRTLASKYQKKANNGIWRLDKSWPDLAELAGFDKSLFTDVYSYLCSYAHSGGLSLLQVSQADSLRDQQYLSEFAIQGAMILMSNFVVSYGNVFPDAGRILSEASAEIAEVVRKWRMAFEAQ